MQQKIAACSIKLQKQNKKRRKNKFLEKLRDLKKKMQEPQAPRI